MTEQQNVPLHLDAYFQELDSLLEAFCTDKQQAFCLEQHVATASQLHQIRQTIQQVRLFSPLVGLVGGPNSASLHHTLTRTCQEMNALYDAACRRRHIARLSDPVISRLWDDWLQLRETFRDKQTDHKVLSTLLDSITLLYKSWKRPDHVQNMFVSIVASLELPPGMYMASVDRRNYAQLGLKRSAIGSRQIVFESGLLTRQEQIAKVADLCSRFSAIFMQNAQHYLAQIESQTHLLQSHALARRMKRLYDCLFTSKLENRSSQDAMSDASSEPTSSPPPHQASNVPFYRLTCTIKSPSLIWYPTRDRDFPITTMPTPSFIPAPWQWNDLLKPRVPYRPLLFGLVKQRRPYLQFHHRSTSQQDVHTLPLPPSRVSLASASRSDHHLPLPPGLPGNQEPKVMDTGNSPFATLSVDRLCQHLCAAGLQFYKDVLNNVKMRYHQDTRVLDGIAQDLDHIQVSLRLQQSRNAMQRVLVILDELMLHAPDQATHDFTRDAPPTAIPRDNRLASV